MRRVVELVCALALFTVLMVVGQLMNWGIVVVFDLLTR